MILTEQLKQIPDHRHIRGRRHPLWMRLILRLLGFLGGYRGYRPLADFVRVHEGSLRNLLSLGDDQPMPSYSTFRRTSLTVDSQGWASAYNAWSLATLPPAVGVLASIDGKSIRSTSVGGPTAAQKFISVVSMYEHQLGVLYLRLMENAKASEIHVAHASMAEVLEYSI
jgi:hypothetical protein